MIAKCQRTISPRRADAASWEAFRSSTHGSVAIEYGLIAALVVIVIIVTLSQLRNNLIDLPLPAIIAAFDEALS